MPSAADESDGFGFDGSSGTRDLRFALGGPIVLPNFAGPLTSIAEFRAAALGTLEELRAEIGGPMGFDDELSVDELKVLTEEELVERALRDSLEQQQDGDNVCGSLEQANDRDSEDRSAPNDANLPSCSSQETQSTGTHDNSNNHSIIVSGKVSRKGKLTNCRKKRGRHFDRESRAAELEGKFLDRAREISEIKKKQDKEKLEARLHSYCGNPELEKLPPKMHEKNEKTRSLKEQLRSLRSPTLPLKAKARDTSEHSPVLESEVLLCVEIYHNKKSWLKTQEYIVLGSQSLADLRDSIYCLTDTLMEAAGENDSSGYFLIEDTFCNDMRAASSTDYSKPILDWLSNGDCSDEVKAKWQAVQIGLLRKRQKVLSCHTDVPRIPDIKSRKMENTCFADLHFRLGAGYLYCHQGGCQHTMVIRDIRMIHPEDPRDRADYPLHIFQLRRRQKKCSICKIYLATKMTVEDKWAPKDPCYFCIKCYYLLHYKEDHSLLYPHTVYDYYHEL